MAGTAVFFDFDGVIADSEPLHYRAYQRVLEPEGLGFSWTEYRDVYIGFDDRDAFREVFRRRRKPLGDARLRRLVECKGAAFREIAAATPPALYPGVQALIADLRRRAPLALCTGALPDDIVPILDLTGLAGAFDVVVTAADVQASKPDPACYRLALERLRARHPAAGLVAAACVAVEDTPAGIAAASGAGLRVLAVATTHPAAALLGARRVVGSLAELSPDELLSVGRNGAP